MEDIFKFYREVFLPAYSDLVALLNDKPSQIVTEIENTFSHVAQVFNPELSKEEKDENVKKAYNHLVRASLDCYKLMCVKLKDLIEGIYISKPDFKPYYEDYIDFINEFRKAREVELKNVGVYPLASLEIYKRAVEKGKNLLGNLIRLYKVKPKVFVAYRFVPEDEKIADNIKKLLELEGFICVDGKTAKAEDVSDKVKREIENSDGVVVIFTKVKELANGKWTTSSWLKDEKAFALGRNKPILLFFEDCIDPDERKGIHGDLEYLTFNRDQMDKFLLKAIPYIRDFYRKILEFKGFEGFIE